MKDYEKEFYSIYEKEGLALKDIKEDPNLNLVVKFGDNYPYLRVYANDEFIDYLDLLPSLEIFAYTFPFLYEGEPINLFLLSEKLSNTFGMNIYFNLEELNYDIIGVMPGKVVSSFRIRFLLRELREKLNKEKIDGNNLISFSRKILEKALEEINKKGKVYWAWEEKYLETVKNFLV